jgi:hypothetical protein
MKRSMTRWTLAGCVALAALGAAAVLDVGSRAAEAAPSPSPFAGSWSGTWSLPVHNESGTFDWTISDEGRITGTVHVTTPAMSGTIVGHVGADGDLVFVGFAPSDTPRGGGDGYPFQGTAVIDGDGRLLVSAPHPQNIHLLVAILERY